MKDQALNPDDIDNIYEEVTHGNGDADPDGPEENPGEPDASGEADDGDIAPVDTVAVVVGAPHESAGEGESAPEAGAEGADAGAGAGPEGGDADPLAARRAELDAHEQRLKSWEGRLKASDKSGAGDAPAGESAPDDAELQAAQQLLIDDLGEPLAKALMVVATALAAKAAGAGIDTMRGAHNEFVGSLASELNRMHSENVEEAKEEYGVTDAEISEFIDTLDAEDAGKFKKICESGSTAQCSRLIRLVSRWKAEKKSTAIEAPAEDVGVIYDSDHPAPDAEEDPDGEEDADPPSAPIRIPEKTGSDLSKSEIDDIYG